MSASEARYVPAAGRRVFTRLYDPVIALTMRERTFRGRLLEQVLAGLPAAGGRIVDVGCGTGTIAIALAAAAPAADVTGVDGDSDVLSLAMRKRGAERVTWTEGLATSLPVPESSADRVVMSLLLHHLAPAAKRQALAEALRVLRPGGRLHIADWGRPPAPLMRVAFFLTVQLVDGLEGTRDHAIGRLPQLIAEAGFADVVRRDRLWTPWGSLELMSAVRPGALLAEHPHTGE
jgi:ubiquinone/menaquinone biosynthesis C-methylase UbiE